MIKRQAHSVGIIGCGWLGKPLVKALVGKAFAVVATTQSTDKLALLESYGATGELLSLPVGDVGLVAQNKVFGCQTLVICITPQIRQGKNDYPKKIAQIVQAAQAGLVDKIILISTTAIYDGYHGEVSEQLAVKTTNEKVAILAQAEQQVLEFSGTSLVLRCAGLVGEDRQPGRFFNQNRKLKSPNAYVNLIHQDDVVQQLLLLIESTELCGIYNAVADMNISKCDFYRAAAEALNIAPPSFEQASDNDKGKRILGDKLVKALNYQYRHPDLLAWLSTVKLS